MSLNPIADVPDFSLAAPTVAEALKDVCIESHAPAKDYKGNVETNITRMLAAPAGFTHRTAPTLVKGIEALKAGPMYERRAREEGVGVAGLGLTREKKKPPPSMTDGEVAAGAHGIDRIVAAGPSRTTLDSIVTPDMFASRFAVREGGEFVEDNSNAFLVHNLLTPIECEYIIATAEPHMKPLDKLYAQRTRLADRAMLRSPTVAQQLCRRLMPFITKEDYVGRTPLCFGHDGVWAPLGLNECLKVFRYDRGGMFVPHRDGPWVPRPDQCSMYTVVIYLNDDFVGGQTVMSGSHDYCGPQGCRTHDWESSAKSSMMHAVPIQGTALVLNHDCWHAAHPIDLGVKWILRTELIFQRVHSFYVDKDAFGTDETYRAARALYDASLAASEAGDRDTFFTSYQEVVRMQREAMLSEAARRGGRLLPSLGLEELSNILSFLPIEAVVRCVMPLNRNTYAAVSQAPLWQDLWEGHVRGALPMGGSLSHVDACAARLMAPMAALSRLTEAPADSSAPGEHAEDSPAHCHGDYFGLYRQHVWLSRRFAPAALLLLDSGAVIAAPTDIAKRPGHTFSFRDCHSPNTEPVGVLDASVALRGKIDTKTPATAGAVYRAHCAALAAGRGQELFRLERYFGSWLYAYPYHMNQPKGEVLCTSDDEGDCEGQLGGSAKHTVDPIDGKVEWSVAAASLDRIVEAADTPIIVVAHPSWHVPPRLVAADASSSEDDSAARHCREAVDALFGLLSVPAVGFYHPGLCAAVGYEAMLREGGDVSSVPAVLTFEMRYGFTMFGGAPVGGLHDDAVKKYYFTVNMRNLCVEACAVCGGGVRPSAMPSPDVILVDCMAKPEPYEYRQQGNPAPPLLSGDALLPADCDLLAAVRADVSEQRYGGVVPQVFALCEVLAKGAAVIGACPALRGALTYRIPFQ